MSKLTIDPSDVTILFQGGVGSDYDMRYVVEATRRVFPGAPVFLATQESETAKLNRDHGFDMVVGTPDPGSLPSVKTIGAPHNVNRQIASAAGGLAGVTTPFAIKMRTDSFLMSRAVLDYWCAWQDAKRGPNATGRDRILAVSFFTVNPRYDERVPFHVSDWFQFGRTEDLQQFWACPWYDRETGTWYETRPYHPESLKREREFRSRYATEQWLTINYMSKGGAFPIEYHNHSTPEIIEHFEQVLVDDFIITHPFDIDLYMPKHRWVFKSTYFNALCYSYPDWERIMKAKHGEVRSLGGHTQWPRTEAEKAFYMRVRTGERTQRLRDLPGPIGRYVNKRFFAWD